MRAEAGDLRDLEPAKRGPERFALAQDRDPREPGLETLERQQLEQRVVAVQRPAPLLVVVRTVERVPRAPGAEELSDLVGRCIGARCWIGVNMNRLCRR